MFSKKAFLLLIIIVFIDSPVTAQWQKVDQISSQFVYSALFTENDYFAGGDMLYVSRDRGISWFPFQLGGSAVEVTALFKHGGILYAGTYGTGIFKSSNNGNDWQSFSTGLNSFALFAVKFVLSGDTIFYASDGGGIYYLAAGSDSWQSYNQNLPSNIAWTVSDLVVTNNNLVASAGQSGFYYIRPKGSAQWIEKRIETPGGIFFTPKSLLSTGDIVFAGGRFGIYKSLDEGVTFDSIGIPAMDMTVVSLIMQGSRIYAGYTRSLGNDFFVWYSDDLGQTWNIYAHEFQFLHHLYIYDNKIWAATNNGLWYNSLEPSAVEEGGIVREFGLSQNYPNPFNPLTTIEFQLSGYLPVSLVVYDVLGREVETLINEVKAPGQYGVNWNAAAMPGGVYFYRLRAGDYSETKKMILMR